LSGPFSTNLPAHSSFGTTLDRRRSPLPASTRKQAYDEADLPPELLPDPLFGGRPDQVRRSGQRRSGTADPRIDCRLGSVDLREPLTDVLPLFGRETTYGEGNWVTSTRLDIKDVHSLLTFGTEW